jgi:capsular polysaccharide biosynthesis protein
LESDVDSGFVKISFDHSNRDSAANILNIVTTEGDSYLKEVNEGLYLSQLDFVMKKIAETSNLEVINALRAYLMNVVLSKTLLSDSNSYAIRSWGGVSVTSLPTKPPVVMAFLFGFILGPLLALSLIFFGRWIRPKA